MLLGKETDCYIDDCSAWLHIINCPFANWPSGGRYTS